MKSNYLSLRREDLVQMENALTPNFAGKSLGDVISAAIPYVFSFAGFALLIYIIFSGYKFLTSQGDSKKVEIAKENLTTAIIGFIIIFTSYFIVQIIGRILGINQIQEMF
ncbi:MAG: pilin [Patescibacteria group bacterium]|nr:pilin [Patescibacteria group bacterium]